MFERRISAEEVRTLLSHAETIVEYPDDKLFPSRLLLGCLGHRPVHIVAAHNQAAGDLIVITVYEPDPVRWESSFKRRKTE